MHGKGVRCMSQGQRGVAADFSELRTAPFTILLSASHKLRDPYTLLSYHTTLSCHAHQSESSAGTSTANTGAAEAVDQPHQRQEQRRQSFGRHSGPKICTACSLGCEPQGPAISQQWNAC